MYYSKVYILIRQFTIWISLETNIYYFFNSKYTILKILAFFEGENDIYAIKRVSECIL